MKQSLREIISILVLLLVLSTATAVPAAAEGEWDGSERTYGASLTVNEIIPFLIEDVNDDGLQFGSIVPGSNDNPDEAQAENGALLFIVGVECNVILEVVTKANDYTSGADVIPIKNAKWNTIDDSDSATAMSKDEVVIAAEVISGWQQPIWHWLSIPDGQAPGSYGTQYYYEVRSINV